MMPFLMTVDSLFDKDAQERFKQIFGVSSSRANDILSNRLGLMTYLVDKREIVKAIPDTKTVNVKIPNGEDYTLDKVREEMKDFIVQRMRYYEQNMHLFVDIYEEGLEEFEKTLKSDAQKQEYRTYRSYVQQIRANYDPALMKEMVVFCNKYEKNVIMPTLPKDLRDAFKNARSVVKYYFLKVQGEALGGILGRKRAQCAVDLVAHADLPMMIDNSASKSLIFSSYVSVVKTTQEYLKKEGYEPVVVYADTNKNLSKIIAQFTNDRNIDPLVATYDSLSTAVPILAASTVILLNAPFRDYEYTQAVSRVDRLGQMHPVTIWNVYLDTGTKPNLSTRSKDILKWSKEQVEQILGKKTGDSTIALETYSQAENYFTPLELVELPGWLNWYLCR
jgi:SNF2 family DNA or RNA helicase